MKMDTEQRRMYIFLLALTVACTVGLQGWRTLLNNFAVEIAHVDGMGMGVVQSLREVPGFLALLIVYVLLVIKEHRLAALSILILGLGVALTGVFPSVWGLALTTVIMSFGFHFAQTCNQSMSLQYFDSRLTPVVLGRQRSAGAIGNLVIGGLVFVLAGKLSYPALFAGIGGLVMLAGAVFYCFKPNLEPAAVQRRGMVFKKNYWLFYVLTFLAGARRQIFTAFAVFLLVQRFGYSVRDITVLFVINNIINWYAGPRIGRAVARFGERKMLSVEYAGLIFVFLVYGFSSSKWLVAVMYVVDNLLFGFNLGINTFFQKIADPSDIAPSMAMGFTINHIAAVLLPFIGGLVWMLHPSAVFVGGAALSALSLFFVQFIRLPQPAPAKA